MQALSSALGLRLRVEYLDSVAMPWSCRAGMHRHVVCGPSAASVVSGACPHRDGRRPTLAACLLFRPGHYDLLAPKDWAEAAGTAAGGEEERDNGASFVPPAPPPPPPKTG